MTYDEWEEKFMPITFAPNSPMGNCMLETYGVELEIVANARKNCVWTVIGGGDDKMYVAAGNHLVNRLGYLITEVPWTEEDHEADILYD